MIKYTVKYVVVNEEGEEHTYCTHSFDTYEEACEYFNDTDDEETLTYLNIMTDGHYVELLRFSSEILVVINFEN